MSSLVSSIFLLSSAMTEETRDDMIKEESEVESILDNQSIVTDSFVDEKLRYRDEFEDYTSLAFERDLAFHTSLGRAKRRTVASVSEDRTSERSAESGSCGYTKQLELQVVELLGLKDQLAQERLGREQLELQLGQKEKELGVARQQVASLVLERDTYKRQISDLKSTVEYQEAKMESKAATKEPFLSRFAERRSLRKKKGDKKEAKERVASPPECEAQGIISSFAKLNMKAPGSVARSSSSPDQVSRLAAEPAPAQSHAPAPRPSAAEQQDFANQCKEFQMEIEKISSHVEHLKSQNHVLTLTRHAHAP